MKFLNRGKKKSILNYILKQVLYHLWPQQNLKHNSVGVKGRFRKLDFHYPQSAELFDEVLLYCAKPHLYWFGVEFKPIINKNWTIERILQTLSGHVCLRIKIPNWSSAQ
jgi:hypothetical protein